MQIQGKISAMVRKDPIQLIFPSETSSYLLIIILLLI